MPKDGLWRGANPYKNDSGLPFDLDQLDFLFSDEFLERTDPATGAPLSPDQVAWVRDRQRLGRDVPNPGLARHRPLPAVMAAPPTIGTPSTTDAATPISVPWNSALLRKSGGVIELTGTSGIDLNSGMVKNRSFAWFVGFWHDGTLLEIRVKGLAGTRFRLMVDGELASAGPQGAEITSTGTSWFCLYTFADACPRQMRFEMGREVRFHGVRTGQSDTGSDGVHPTVEGHRYLGLRAAASVAEWIDAA